MREGIGSSSTKEQPLGRPTRRSPGSWRRWRPVLVRMHFYAGLLAGPFLVLTAFTGLLDTLVPQIDRAVYRHELTVDQVGDHRLALSAQLAAARTAHPEGTLKAVNPATEAHETTRVILDVPDGDARTVFVDPYTAEIRGVLGTSGLWLPVRAWFDEFHRNLHLGSFGRHYSELAASWLWVLSLGGVVMWVVQRRKQRKLSRLATPDRDAPRRARWVSWHAAIGVWVVVGLLGLSVTGLIWSRLAGDHIADLRAQLHWHTPTVSTSLDSHHEVELGAGMDRALNSATKAGLAGPMWIYPAAHGKAWKVTERKRDWPVRADSVALDPHTGIIVDHVRYADWSTMAKLTTWALYAHMGTLFGIPNQIVLALLMIGLLFMTGLGYRMWWRRRPTPPKRGALAELKPIEAVALVIGVSAVGLFIPWFGLSLGAFVIADYLVGLWRSGDRAKCDKSGQPNLSEAPLSQVTECH